MKKLCFLILSMVVLVNGSQNGDSNDIMINGDDSFKEIKPDGAEVEEIKPDGAEVEEIKPDGAEVEEIAVAVGKPVGASFRELLESLNEIWKSENGELDFPSVPRKGRPGLGLSSFPEIDSYHNYPDSQAFPEIDVNSMVVEDIKQDEEDPFEAYWRDHYGLDWERAHVDYEDGYDSDWESIDYDQDLEDLLYGDRNKDYSPYRTYENTLLNNNINDMDSEIDSHGFIPILGEKNSELNEDPSQSDKDSSQSDEDYSQSDEDSSQSDEDSSQSDEDSSQSDEDSSQSGEDYIQSELVNLAQRRSIMERINIFIIVDKVNQAIPENINDGSLIIKEYLDNPEDHSNPINSGRLEEVNADLLYEDVEDDSGFGRRYTSFKDFRSSAVGVLAPLLMIFGIFLMGIALISLLAVARRKSMIVKNKTLTRLDVPYKELSEIRSEV